jgi:hypothetical protein
MARRVVIKFRATKDEARRVRIAARADGLKVAPFARLAVLQAAGLTPVRRAPKRTEVSV